MHVSVRGHAPERQDKAAGLPQSMQHVDTKSSNSSSSAAFIKRSEERNLPTIISSSNQFKEKS